MASEGFVRATPRASAGVSEGNARADHAPKSSRLNGASQEYQVTHQSNSTMPRGSEPGERRGGRQRATPNKRTVLTDRILAVASAHPSAARHEVLTILVKDPALPADIRIAVARQSLPARASRSTKALAARSYARSSSTGMAPDARGDVASQGSHKPAHSPAPVTLDVLFSVAQDVTTIPARRRKSGIGGSAAFPAENSCQRRARRCR